MSLQKYFPFAPMLNQEDENFFLSPVFSNMHTNLSVSEDDKKVYVEAALPGLTPNEIDMTFQKGVLTIRGSKKEEQGDKKKYYRKASRMYSYTPRE